MKKVPIKTIGNRILVEVQEKECQIVDVTNVLGVIQ